MRNHKRRTHLNDLPIYTGQFTTPTSVQILNYSQQTFSEKTSLDLDAIKASIDAEGITWVRIRGMNESELIRDIIRHVGLTDLDAKDILTMQHLMTVEEYDKNIFIVMPVPCMQNDKKVTEQLALIAGQNYLISIQESDTPQFESIYAAIKNNQYLKFTQRKADFLMATILDEVIHSYGDEVVHLEDCLEDFEDQLLDTKQLHNNLIGEIQEKRREMIHLRKLLLPFKEQLAKLLRADANLINDQERPYFKDIYDQLLYLLQSLESCREILSSLVDLYLNNNDVKLNEVMKQLTVVATIFIPLTFLVGVWGMNFDNMPELNWPYGYLYAWILMLIIGLAVWWYLRRQEKK